eukprot:TRINITY_DN3502_c0_g1_i13.p1 TRINITY_DN3502_c0_g1~~TRINITY_DN3502_c0_g1_i13.p1  ORF type:complete len:190 (+),score=22.39 TRINITY_DN3502_c0_g1_i13:110-679(+)
MPRCPAALVDETSTFFPLSDEKFSSNVEGLISGVTYIHNSGMVHVDIKAGNIFIQPDGSWILGDYGSTVVINGEILEATTNRHNQQAKVEFDWYHLWEAMLMFLLQEKWAELFEENRISTCRKQKYWIIYITGLDALLGGWMSFQIIPCAHIVCAHKTSNTSKRNGNQRSCIMCSMYHILQKPEGLKRG